MMTNSHVRKKMITQPSVISLCERCGQEHPDCVVCSPTNLAGLQLPLCWPKRGLRRTTK
jgi:hypothetical protein